MEFRQLRYFKTIADARSFARGAEHLRVAQPALSRSIARLEEDMGQQLFLRHSTGVTMTDAGIRLYRHASSVLDRMQLLTDDMAAARDAPHGMVSLGAPPSLQTVLTAPAAAAFARRYPKVTMSILQSTSVSLREALLEGLVDLAIVASSMPSRGLHFRPFLTEGVCLVQCVDQVRPLREELEVEDLVGLPLILCGFPKTMRRLLEEAFEATGATPDVRLEVNSSALVIDLVTEGAGAGVVPSCAVVALEARGFHVTPVRGIQFSWTIATPSERAASTAVRMLATTLIDRAAEVISTGAWPAARLLDESRPQLPCVSGERPGRVCP
jgi:LysR family nitrogen assimilation transcriptional regulator